MARSAKPTRFRDKWRIRWIDAEGKRRSGVFVSYAEAERELRRRQVEADEIRRGARLAEPAQRTFDDLATYWLEPRAVHKRSRKDDESILRRHLLPAFGSKPLRGLSVEDIDRYKSDKCDLAPKTVANHLTLLKTMLRVAEEDLHWLLRAPTIRKPKVDPDDEVDPPWLETQEDIGRLLVAARQEADPEVPLTMVPFVMYATAVYTGMRAGELAGLRWSDVHFDKRFIHVRRSYGGKTKTRASRRDIPIQNALLPILEDWRSRCPATENGLTFPNQAGRMHGPSASVFQEVLHRCLDRAGFVRPADGTRVHVIHFHSLRHTFASHWRINGGRLEELIRVLGHTSKAMTEHYANVGGYHRPEHLSIFPALPVTVRLVPPTEDALHPVGDHSTSKVHVAGHEQGRRRIQR